MFKVLSSLVFASLAIQLLNYLFIRYSGDGGLFDYVKVVMFTLPVQLVASVSFAYFYSQGVRSEVSYFQLSLLSIVLSLALSLFVSVFVLRGASMSMVEWFACGFTLVGIVLFLVGRSEV